MELKGCDTCQGIIVDCTGIYLISYMSDQYIRRDYCSVACLEAGIKAAHLTTKPPKPKEGELSISTSASSGEAQAIRGESPSNLGTPTA